MQQPDRRAERGLMAKQIAENEVFKESVEVLRAGYVSAMKACRPDDDRGRRLYAEALNQVDRVIGHLIAVIATGELAEREAAEFRTLSAVERLVRKF